MFLQTKSRRYQSEDTNEEDVQQEETTPRTVKPRGMGIG